MNLQKFNIKGMRCYACQTSIEKNITNLKGVLEASVSFLNNTMTVKYDAKILNDTNIISSINDLGYEATLVYDLKDKQLDNNTKLKNNLIISFVCLIPLIYISMGHMFNVPFLNIFSEFNNILVFSSLQFLLVLPIILANSHYYKVGFKSLLKFHPNMDSLVALGTSASAFYGIFALFKIYGSFLNNDINSAIFFFNDLYFETTGVILSLITFGKYLESKAKKYTSTTIESLINLTPKKILLEHNKEEKEININDLREDDIVIVKQGSIIPADGVIIFGNCLIDESMLTGESILVDKNKNDSVIAGSINKSGYIKFRVTKSKEDTVLAQIIKLVEEASSSKSPISKLVDQISMFFVPFIISISILSFVFWMLYGYSFGFSLSIAISVLIISCPCALGLATPISIMIGIGKAYEHGILIKNAQSLENAYKINTVVLDKTGTITQGIVQVTNRIVSNKISIEKLLQYCASIERKSEHILSNAIIQKAVEENLNFIEIDDFKIIDGQGIEARIKNDFFYLGNKKLLENKNILINELIEESKRLASDGKIIVYLANNKEVLGLIAISDFVKPTSKDAILKLKEMNLDVIMLTGDNELTAKSIAKQVGINSVFSEVLPQEKYQKIKDLQEIGQNVAMVGDGINDAPALAQANISIATGSRSDIAIQSSNVVLVKNDLNDLITLIKLSKETIKNIKQNLFFAFFYNIIGIPLAAGVFYILFSLKLNPMFASFVMSISSLAVVVNASRLRFIKINDELVN